MKEYGGSAQDEGRAVIECSSGGFAVAGWTGSFGVGGMDIWLLRTDGNGNHLWNETYGTPNVESAYDVAECTGGGFVIAGYTINITSNTADAVLVRTNDSGSPLWYKTYGGSSCELFASVIECSSGGFALAGYIAPSLSGGDGDLWLERTDANGNHLWSKIYGGSRDEGAFSIVECSDGGFALGGWRERVGFGDSDFWLVRTDETGSSQWTRSYGGSGDDLGLDLIECASGGFAFAGFTYSFGAGEKDAWLVRTNSTGGQIWNHTYGGSDPDDAWGVVEVSDGFALVGMTASFATTGYSDLWVVRTNAAGQMVWNQAYSLHDADYGYDIAACSDGTLVITGATSSPGRSLDVCLLRVREMPTTTTGPPPIPGFPWPAIAAGTLAALGLGVLSRRRPKNH